MTKTRLRTTGKGKSGDPEPNKEKSNREKIYQLRISLSGSDPEIWRRVLVSGDTTLGALHYIIQDVMGWDNELLHEFIPKDARYADPESAFLPHYAECLDFVNADLIAGGLSPFDPGRAAIQAGRLMLEEIHSLSRTGRNFGFETTLAGRTQVISWIST